MKAAYVLINKSTNKTEILCLRGYQGQHPASVEFVSNFNNDFYPCPFCWSVCFLLCSFIFLYICLFATIRLPSLCNSCIKRRRIPMQQNRGHKLKVTMSKRMSRPKEKRRPNHKRGNTQENNLTLKTKAWANKLS